MPTPWETRSSGEDSALLALRGAVLALVVLEDIDLEPRHDGVGLPGGGYLTWEDVEHALGSWVQEPDHAITRRRLRAAVEVATMVHIEGPGALLSRTHAHGEPVDGSAMHPGLGWVRSVVPGGVLHLGLGISDLPGVPGPTPLPTLPSVSTALGSRAIVHFAQSREDLERLGGLLVARLSRDAAEGRPQVLRPVGPADVVTLLASRRVREHLASGDGTGMRALAVPVRDRGWFDLARIDPAYVTAAWGASEARERAFGRSLLVTADEVGSPALRGDVLAGVLADPAADPLWREVRWR